jgi:hypothetical protein
VAEVIDPPAIEGGSGFLFDIHEPRATIDVFIDGFKIRRSPGR